MSFKAQHDYYKLPSAASVLERRIEALAEAIPSGSIILDLGCNDCSISTALVRRGIIAHSFGYDLEDLRQDIVPEVTFTAKDLMETSVAELPSADGVIILNVLHHLVARSPEGAKKILRDLLDRYEFVILDMGSFSERGDWGWRQKFNNLWQSDIEMWENLFGAVALKFKLLRYPTQGGGHRVLWKLYKHSYDLTNLRSCGTFVKTPGASALDKALVQSDDGSPIDFERYGSVYFEKLVTPRQDFFWRKTYTTPSSRMLVQLEYSLIQICSKALSTYGSCSISKIVMPVMMPEDNSLLYIYEPDLFSEKCIHYQDWLDVFDVREVQDLLRLSAWPVEFRNFTSKIQLLNLVDFQAANCWDGLKVLDLEPNLWVRELLDRIDWF